MRWILGAMLAALLVVIGSTAVGCSSCDACGRADASTDATTAEGAAADVNEGGGCACPKPDAALFNPNGTSCCAGSSCVAQHFDGLTHGFYDCYGVGAWATQLAMDACNAYFDAGATCTPSTCGSSQVVEGMTSQKCVTWAYQGDSTAIGHVRAAATTTCECAAAGDPTWF